MPGTVNIKLSKTEFDRILQDFYARENERKKLSQEEAEVIASRLNERFNVPFAGEKWEQKIFVKLVVKVDNFLYNHLANELYDLARSLEEGIDDTEAERLVRSLAKLANEKVDIKYVPEIVEFGILSFVVGWVVNAMRKHWSFDKVAEQAVNLPVAERSEDLGSLAILPEPA